MIAALAIRGEAELTRWSRELGRNSVRVENRQSAVSALAGQIPQYLSREKVQSSHQSVSVSPHQSGAERAMPQLEQNPRVLKDRIRNAMKRRVGPNTGLTVKMVARATGLTERTIENASSGTIPRGDTLTTLLDFFDASFANEVFAGTTFMIVKLSDQRAADAARQINEGIRVLAELGRGR